MNQDIDVTVFSGASREGKQRLKKAFAQLLQKELLAKNWNQSELAAKAGLGRDAISTYVNARSFPEPKSMKAIADALGKPIDALYPKIAGDSTPSHAIAIRQDEKDPMRVYLTINRSIPISLAGQIVEMVKSEIE